MAKMSVNDMDGIDDDFRGTKIPRYVTIDTEGDQPLSTGCHVQRLFPAVSQVQTICCLNSRCRIEDELISGGVWRQIDMISCFLLPSPLVRRSRENCDSKSRPMHT